MWDDQGRFTDRYGNSRRNKKGAPIKELQVPVKELCELFDVSRQTIYRWTRSIKDKNGNKIPALLNPTSLLSICKLWTKRSLSQEPKAT